MSSQLDESVPLVLVPPTDALTPLGILEGIGKFGRAAKHRGGPAGRAARWFFWSCIGIPYLAFFAVGALAVVGAVLSLAFG